MPKKKKGRRDRKDREEDWSDTDSVGSSIWGDEDEDEDQKRDENPEQMLAVAFDMLSERRTQTRQEGFQSMLRILQSNYLPVFLATGIETMKTGITNALRKHGGQETSLALRVLSVAAITFGADGASDLFHTFFPLLSTYLRNSSKPPAVRAEALYTLGIITLVGCEDVEEDAKVRELFVTIFANEETSSNSSGSGPQPEVIADALTAWSVVASALPVPELASCNSTILPHVVPLLENDIAEVRLAAGTAIALIYSAKTQLEEAGADEDNEEGSYELEVDVVVAALEELATDSKRSRGKKERKKQRQLFREVLRTVQEDHVPHESLTLDKIKHSFEGWDIVLQLEAFRRCLSTGLSTHLKWNSLLHDIFGIDPTEAPQNEMSKEDIAYAHASRAKVIHSARAKARRQTALQKQAYNDDNY